MARKTVSVELAEYLSDQDAVQRLGQVSAPTAARIDRLLTVLRDARQLGSVGPAELISALVHAQPLDVPDLAAKVETYRRTRVWEARESMGEITGQNGKWRIHLRGPGER